MKKKNLVILVILILLLTVLSACGREAENKMQKSSIKDTADQIASTEEFGDESTIVMTESQETTGKNGENPVSSSETNEKVLPPAEESGMIHKDGAIENASELYQIFDNALFIGDSRTEGLSLYSGITNADFFCAKSLTIDRIVNGEAVKVGGNKISIYELLEGKEYTSVYISLGLNELGWVHIEDFVNAYKTLIGAVRESQPDAVVYVQSLIPVTEEKSAKGGIVTNEQIYWYNTHIVEIAEETGVNYLNADAPLINENGALLPDATTDGVHFKSDYCRIWAEKIAELSQQ